MPTVLFETLGCKLNQIETEALAEAFARAGFAVAHREANADAPADADARAFARDPIVLSVVNTCTVTGKAEQKARGVIRSLLRAAPAAPVLVTGCYAEVDAAALSGIDPRVVPFPGTRKGELADLPTFLADALAIVDDADRALDALRSFAARGKPGEGTSFRLSTDTFRFHSRASIKVQDGCDNRCAYCRIRLARGQSVSLDPAEVVARVRAVEESGLAEIVLTGVNLSQYRSGGDDIARLIERLLRATSRVAFRVSSLYPERVDDALAPILADPRVRPHFHLSVQSGSDHVLERMRRPYRRGAVLDAVNRLRANARDPFIACDLIAGFPGEDEEDFRQTLDLCQAVGFAGIHPFPFSPRPGTEAWGMRPRVPERVAGERVAALLALGAQGHEAYKRRWIGRPLAAVVERADTILTENYLSAHLDSGARKPGSGITVVLTAPGHARVAP